MKQGRVVVVCTGNICRSPMAEGLLRVRLAQAGRDTITVTSMGVRGLSGSPATPRACKVCRENGIDIVDHRARRLVGEELAGAEFIFTMDLVQRDIVLESFPQLESRIFLLASWPQEANLGDVVPDPIGRPLRVYRAVYRDIDQHVRRILPHLLD